MRVPRSGNRGIVRQPALGREPIGPCFCKRLDLWVPKSVGAWVQGWYLELGSDARRYLGEKGRSWLKEHGVKVAKSVILGRADGVHAENRIRGSDQQSCSPEASP